MGDTDVAEIVQNKMLLPSQLIKVWENQVDD